MGSPYLEVATDAHAAELAPRMRAEDVAEVLAAGGYTPEEALRVSLLASEVAYTVLVDGEVLCLFGVAPSSTAHLLGQPEAGVVWALTSTAAEAHRVALARGSRMVVGALLERYRLLFNFIDARYVSALRWVRFLGFEVLPAIPYGASRRPFHPVRLRSP